MRLQFRPIVQYPDDWLGPDDMDRQVSKFTATWPDTLDVLDRELWQLGTDPESVILQVAASQRDVRMDGQLRSDAKVSHPGVILSFDSADHGTLTYACDAFRRPTWGAGARVESWKHNVRAIALGLEALRKVERYGIANRGQQYAGYAQLGSGIPMGPASMTDHDAVMLLWPDPPDMTEITDDDVRRAFQQAAKLHHPDLGGDPAVFRRLVEARDRLLA